MVGALPELRGFGAVRELQHFDDVSQEPEPAGVPLLRIDSDGAECLSEVRIEVRLFFWGGVGASGGAVTEGISGGEDCPTGSGHGADEAAIPGDARGLRERDAGHFGGNADAGEGARFS